MATLLLSTALVPMMMALFRRSRPSRRGGQLAAVVGLVSASLLFGAFFAFGVFDAEEETLTLQVHLGSFSHVVEREETLLVTAPLSLVAYAVGALLDRRRREVA